MGVDQPIKETTMMLKYNLTPYAEAKTDDKGLSCSLYLELSEDNSGKTTLSLFGAADGIEIDFNEEDTADFFRVVRAMEQIFLEKKVAREQRSARPYPLLSVHGIKQ